MKRVTRRTVLGLLLCAAVLASPPAATGKDKSKHHGRAPILALAQDGTTWIAGEARFDVVGGALEVAIDLASGVPNAQVSLYLDTNPSGIILWPVARMILTDARGDLKCSETYGLMTTDPFDVWVGVSVEGTAVGFSTDKANPVTIDPKG